MEKVANVSSRPIASVFTFASSQFLALVMGLLLQVVVARNLLPTDYARFVIANTVMLALTLGLVSAIPKASVRWVSIDRSRVGEVWRTIGSIHFPICLGVALLLFLGGSSLPADDRLAFAVKLVVIELVIRAGLLEPAWGLLNGMHRHREQAALMLAHSVFRLLCVGVFLFSDLGNGPLVLAGCILSLAVASLTSLAVTIFVMKRSGWGQGDSPEYSSGQGKDAKGKGEQRKGERETGISMNRELVKWIRMAPVAEILNYLVVASNLWFLKAMSDDSVGVGVYAACFMLAQSVMPFGIAVSRGTFATLASLFHENRVREVSLLVRNVLRGVLVIASCAISIAFVLGPSMVSLFFGSEYRDSGSLLGILMVGTFGIAIVWLLGDVLNAAGWLPIRLTAMIGIGFVAALGCATLIPAFGRTGAAWALLGTGVSGAVILALVVGFRVPGCVPFGTIVRSAIASWVSILIFGGFFGDQWRGILVGVFAIFGVNLFFLVIFQEWNRANFAHLLDTVRSLSYRGG